MAAKEYTAQSMLYRALCSADIYRRVHWNNRGKKSIVWRCVNRLEERASECESLTLLEEDIQNAVTKAIKQLISGRDSFVMVLKNNIETVLNESLDKDTSDIDNKLNELQNEILRFAELNARAGAGSSKYDKEYESIASTIHGLRQQKQDISVHNADR